MKNDLISREALKKAIEECKYCGFYGKLIEIIDNAPTVAERPQGEWLFHRCSLCGRYDARDNENFCSNCGADMRKGGA